MSASPSYLHRPLWFLSAAVLLLLLCGVSLRAQVRGTRPDETVPSSFTGSQHYYALVIGNNDYQYEPKLKTAVNDAEAVANMLSTQYGFKVELLLNATRSQIMGALNQNRRTLTGDSSLLIYYAGHGARDEANGLSFWLPVDAAVDDTTNWIDASSMASLVKSMAALHVLVISDSCFSGGMRSGVNAEDVRTTLAKKLELPSRTLMASGSNEPVADAGGTGHSIFAEAFLQGLADPNQAAMTGAQLFVRYIEPVVSGRASQTPMYVPLRQAGEDRGDFVFIRHAASGNAPKSYGSTPAMATEQPVPRAPSHYEIASIDAMTVPDALATIERVQHMLPKGDAGQIAAAESLIRAHHSLSGFDLSGLSLRSARVPNGDFSNATLVAGDLSKVEAGSTDFSHSDLTFSSLDAAHLEGATLTGAKLDFAVADGAQLQNAKAANLRGFAVSAEKADWTHADLRGARFMFANLRSANFDGADLRGAFFVGSDLTGAAFHGAQFDNTDLSGSKFEAAAMNAAQQKGVCATPGSNIRNISLLIVDDIPSSRYEGGMEHSRWMDALWGFDAKLQGLRSCASRTLQESMWYPIFSSQGKELPTNSFGLAFPDALIQKRGADMRARIEERHVWKLNDMDADCLARCAQTHCTCL